MAGKTATIRDVASQAGVSVSTVSRILSGAETPIAISEETRERVQRAAQMLAYRPHPGARSLRGKGTNLLGLIVREIEDLFFIQLMKSLNAEAKLQGLEIVLGHADANPNAAVRLGQVMLDMRFCDGIFLLGDLGDAGDDTLVLSQIQRSLPVVVLCRGANTLNDTVPSICTDNHQGVNLAMEYLVQLGHRRIAYLGESRSGDFNERLDAFETFMQQHFPGELLVQQSDNTMESGCQGMKQIIDLPNPPTAVFAADDTIAIGALRAAHEYGFRVPQDISIVGFDDIRTSAYTVPALTTVRQPVEKLGQIGIAQMIQMVSTGGSLPTLHVSVEPRLVVRESCAQPRAATILRGS